MCYRMFNNHKYCKMKLNMCVQISYYVFEKVWNRLALMFNNLQQILFLRLVIIVYARCKISLTDLSHRSLWDLVAHWLSLWLSTGGSWVRLPLKPPRRDFGQVLYLQLPVRFGVILRYSIRAVVGSASE